MLPAGRLMASSFRLLGRFCKVAFIALKSRIVPPGRLSPTNNGRLGV